MGNIKTISTPLEDKHWNECRQIAHYQAENKKLKEENDKLRTENEKLRDCLNGALEYAFHVNKGFPLYYNWYTDAAELLKGAEE